MRRTNDNTNYNAESSQEELLSNTRFFERSLRILYFERHPLHECTLGASLNNPRRLAWRNTAQESTSSHSWPTSMWQVAANQIRNEKSTSAWHTETRPWTHTPNNDNFSTKHRSSEPQLWHFWVCVEQFRKKALKKNEFELTTYHFYKRHRSTNRQHSNMKRQTQRHLRKKRSRNFAIDFQTRHGTQLPTTIELNKCRNVKKKEIKRKNTHREIGRDTTSWLDRKKNPTYQTKKKPHEILFHVHKTETLKSEPFDFGISQLSKNFNVSQKHCVTWNVQVQGRVLMR